MTSLYSEDLDATIRWTESASGTKALPPVLYLPGLSMPVLPTLGAVAADPRLTGRRHILLDYLGSGMSDHPEKFDYTLKSHAAVIARVIDVCDAGPVDVVGHSMGGTVAIQLAFDCPNHVRSLVVAEGNFDPGGGARSLKVAEHGRAAFLETGHTNLLHEMRTKALAGSDWADRLYAGWRMADPKGLFGNSDALVRLEPDFFDRFIKLPQPKTFIYGDKGYASPASPDTPDSGRLAQGGVNTAVVANAGHAMMVDNHDGFVDALLTAFA